MFESSEYIPSDGPLNFNLLVWVLQLPTLLKTAGKSLLIVLIVLILYRLASRAIDTLSQRSRIPETLSIFLRRLSRGAAIAVALVLTLEAFGILRDVWVLFSAVLATVAVGFVATWSILSNIFCWIVIGASQPFRIGQTIEIISDNVRGRVRDVDLMYTVIEELDGCTVMIPNNLLVQKSIRRIPSGPPPAVAEPPRA